VGSYYLCAMADSGTTVNEGALESNNSRCTSSPIQVTLPDLVITTISPNAASVNQGAYLSVTDTVHNQGLLPTSSSVRITYHLSVNATYGDADDVVIVTYRTVSSGFAAGASNTATTSLLIPSTTPPNSYYVCALADSLSAVAETDETNNTRCASAPVIVPPPDLIISAISKTATTVAKGANFTLSNTVKNQGGSKAGAFVIAFHLSTNTTYGDGDDVALTQSRSVTSLAIGATSAASTSLTVPSTTPSGTYSVCALADSSSTVPEGDETNNSGCTTTTITVP
jgi:subtilase family serine protease